MGVKKQVESDEDIKHEEAAGFRPKRKITGNEVCMICGSKETCHWYNTDNGKVCQSCYLNPDYKNGLLDIDSSCGFGFLGQRIVAKKLELELKYDCNCTKGFGHKDFDLLQLDNEKYGEIQVKVSALRSNCSSLYWWFGLGNKCDNYIMLGFTNDKSNVVKVWVIKSNVGIISNKTGLTITYKPKITGHIIREIVKYEVDAKSYNDAYHNMSLDNCSVLKKYDV